MRKNETKTLNTLLDDYLRLYYKLLEKIQEYSKKLSDTVTKIKEFDISEDEEVTKELKELINEHRIIANKYNLYISDFTIKASEIKMVNTIDDLYDNEFISNESNKDKAKEISSNIESTFVLNQKGDITSLNPQLDDIIEKGIKDQESIFNYKNYYTLLKNMQ